MIYIDKENVASGKISILRGFDDESREVWEDYHPVLAMEFNGDIYVYMLERMLPLRIGEQRNPFEETFEAIFDGERLVEGDDVIEWFRDNADSN